MRNEIEPRQYTPDEMREELFGAIYQHINYWLSQEETEPREMLDGLVFSIFAMIDGMSGGVGFSLELVPSCHPDDEKFHRDEGDNWYPSQELPDNIVTINGTNHLHHEWADWIGKREGNPTRPSTS